MTLTVASLSSGYGGLEMALSLWLGEGASRVLWHAEVDPDASRVLKEHWPEVPNLGDFTVPGFWESAPRAQAHVGGIPCQPFSAAGRQRGEADHRYLWPFWREGIALHRPATVGLVPFAVLAALVALLLGACDPNAQPAHRPVRAPTANAPAVPNPGGPDVNHPGPQADPGMCVQGAGLGRAPTKRDILLEAHWVSQKATPPIITWAHNGVVTPASNIPNGHQAGPGQLYDGQWSTLVQAQCGDTVSIRLANTRSGTLAICSISDLGQGPVKTGELSCEAHYNVP